MTSGADLAIAWGTIGLAVVTVAGLFVSLRINKSDRERADQQARDDRQAAAELAAADRAVIREDAERRHIVDLLLDLGRQIARQHAHMHDAEGVAANVEVILLLNALPAECAMTARKKFNVMPTMTYPGAIGAKMQHLDLASVTNADPGQIGREIAYDIDRYLTSGRAPSEVWSDLEDLKDWQRRRWPRT